MRTDDFDYALPPELIAQEGVEPRDRARLLVIRRETGSLEHCQVCDLPELLDPGDLLVVNTSRVIPARLFGYRAGPGISGRVELLLLKRRDDGGLWECLVRPARRLKPGAAILIEPGATGGEGLCRAVVESVAPDGIRLVRFEDEAEALRRGHAPLPPYIRNQQLDPVRYQTVYAREPGSAAAPTAGLHFTPELLARLEARGVGRADVVLHVGLDTFRPVASDDPRQHRMHAEWGCLPAASAAAIVATQAAGRRVVAVGTTSVRVLESWAASLASGGPATGWQGETRLFILPGYRFLVVDALMTNFHLPRSTLLMLVSAFAGAELVRRAYAEAIERRYRFYSLGDACLFL